MKQDKIIFSGLEFLVALSYSIIAICIPGLSLIDKAVFLIGATAAVIIGFEILND